jgi:hypothetical protein
VEYKSNIEKYYFTSQDEKFLQELKNFIGYITRKYFPGQRQKSVLYEQIRGDVIEGIYGFLREKRFNFIDGKFVKGGTEFTHYETKIQIVKDVFGRDLDFRSYLYTQIRGELTKFYYKYNIRRKIEVPLIFNEVQFNDRENYIRMELEHIVKNLKMTLEDSLDDITKYLLFNIYTDRNISQFKNIYQVRIIVWELWKCSENKEVKRNDKRN